MLPLFITATILSSVVTATPAMAQQTPKNTLVAMPATLSPGGKTTFVAAGTATITNLSPDPKEGLTCSVENKTAACTAPAAPGSGLAITGDVKVTATLDDGTQQFTTVSLVAEFDAAQRGPWEARVVTGYHQAGAASSDYSQNAIIDIYVVRPLSKNNKVWESRFNSWGGVRIASAPQQINVPFISLLQGLAAPGTNSNAPSPLNTPVNQLVLSAEFQSGLEFNFTPGWNGKMLGLIGFFGATGSFQAPDQNVHIYVAPTADSPQSALFKQRFPSANTAYVGFVAPDRDRFYRQWGVGFRYSRFHPDANYESPQTYTFTLGT